MSQGNDPRDFDAELAAVERFIADVQRGAVPTGEAMRAFRDVHRPAIERLRGRLAEFEALLAEVGAGDAVAGGTAAAHAVGEDPDSGSGSA